MTTLEFCLTAVVTYIAGAITVFWCVARARPLKTDGNREADEKSQEATDRAVEDIVRICEAHAARLRTGTAPVTETGGTGESSCGPVDALPEAPKATVWAGVYKEQSINRTVVIKIVKCGDRSMWYANLIGQTVPYRGQSAEEQIFMSTDTGGYTNIVKMEDGFLTTERAEFNAMWDAKKEAEQQYVGEIRKRPTITINRIPRNPLKEKK